MVLVCVCLGLQSKGTGNPSITAALKTVPLARYSKTLDVYIYIYIRFKQVRAGLQNNCYKSESRL